MTDDRPDEGVLQHQLELTRETWAQLGGHGVTEQSELRLEFFFDAPNMSRAEELVRFLEGETDYDVQLFASEDEWVVRGLTQGAKVSLAILEQWVTWMVQAGLQCECTFDGWGAEVP